MRHLIEKLSYEHEVSVHYINSTVVYTEPGLLSYLPEPIVTALAQAWLSSIWRVQYETWNIDSGNPIKQPDHGTRHVGPFTAESPESFIISGGQGALHSLQSNANRHLQRHNQWHYGTRSTAFVTEQCQPSITTPEMWTHGIQCNIGEQLARSESSNSDNATPYSPNRLRFPNPRQTRKTDALYQSPASSAHCNIRTTRDTVFKYCFFL